MGIQLTTREVAELCNKHESTIRRWAEIGKIPSEKILNEFNSPEYIFNLDSLAEVKPGLVKKYYDQLQSSLPEARFPEEAKPKAAKPLDTYSAEEPGGNCLLAPAGEAVAGLPE